MSVAFSLINVKTFISHLNHMSSTTFSKSLKLGSFLATKMILPQILNEWELNVSRPLGNASTVSCLQILHHCGWVQWVPGLTKRPSFFCRVNFSSPEYEYRPLLLMLFTLEIGSSGHGNHNQKLFLCSAETLKGTSNHFCAFF